MEYRITFHSDRHTFAAYEYQGRMDPTRMRNEDLELKEVKMRVRDLFNLKDPSFRKLKSLSQRSSLRAHYHW
jgi:hypothetical protein